MDLREAIPGYVEALEREALVRDASFLPITETVGQFELRAMTLRDYIALRIAKSPVLFKLAAQPEELIAFLWFLSSCYKPGWGFKAYAIRKLFALRCRRIFRDVVALVETERACQSYLDEVFQDSQPRKSRAWDAAYYSDSCYFVTMFARHFHWAPEVTLQMPMKQVFQCMNEIRSRGGEILSNPSDRVRAEWMLSKRN